jgi:hypothetical protein
MDQEFIRSISEAADIQSSGRWGAMNQKLRQLADNHNGHAVWQIQVIAALCNKNFSEYFALKKAYEDQPESEPSLLAWRARNLLEVSVWSCFCAIGKDNARVFYEDAGRDVFDIYKVFTKWGKITSQGQNWIDPIEKAKHEISRRAKTEGIKSLDGTFKRVSSAAEECGLGPLFALGYKELSKFSHPTAMLIMGDADPEKEKLQRDMFYSNGCMFFVGAFTALEGLLSNLVDNPAQ